MGDRCHCQLWFRKEDRDRIVELVTKADKLTGYDLQEPELEDEGEKTRAPSLQWSEVNYGADDAWHKLAELSKGIPWCMDSSAGGDYGPAFYAFDGETLYRGGADHDGQPFISTGTTRDGEMREFGRDDCVGYWKVWNMIRPKGEAMRRWAIPRNPNGDVTHTNGFTIGKRYEVIRTEGRGYVVLNDNGHERYVDTKFPSPHLTSQFEGRFGQDQRSSGCFEIVGEEDGDA